MSVSTTKPRAGSRVLAHGLVFSIGVGSVDVRFDAGMARCVINRQAEILELARVVAANLR